VKINVAAKNNLFVVFICNQYDDDRCIADVATSTLVLPRSL